MKYHPAYRDCRGTTLLETILYIALLAIVIGGVLTGAAAVFSATDHNRVAAMLQQEAAFVLARCAAVITEGAVVVSPGTHGSQLIVVAADGSRMQLCMASGEARFLAGAGDCAHDGVALDNDDATVDSLVFVRRAEEGASLIDCAVVLSARDAHGGAVSFAATTTRMLRSRL
ncbi:hypothetical protein FJY94_02880 [Candidatus Kaiserbacteria bacterium]|nr:hypothetical protein [Candidatus Kaiserbacteria bacterium]